MKTKAHSLRELGHRLDDAVERMEDRIREIRRYLHAHPEPSGEEFQTTSYLANLLDDAGLDYRIPATGRGLFVDSLSPGGGRRCALRADIDALRLHDAKEVTYRSLKKELMHACGHDAHTAMLAGAVLALRAVETEIPHVLPAWRAIFQPAEESATGALEMMAHGALDEVDSIFALHVDPTIPAGKIGYRHGTLTATCVEFEITLSGKGGHGARPHLTADPIAAAAQLIQTLYAHLPRSLDAQSPNVLSIGMIRGGINPNVIPDEVRIGGTIRTIESDMDAIVRARMENILRGLEMQTGVAYRIAQPFRLEGVRNDLETTTRCLRAAREVFSTDGLIALERPSMGGEDFAHYLREVPGCMMRLGVAFAEGPPRHLHSSHFDVDERALAFGAKMLARAVLELPSASDSVS
ncbi:MAG: amidohydrolase [Opitutales bacterium]|nr:amidohydrolase [Opitutales bacterium]